MLTHRNLEQFTLRKCEVGNDIINSRNAENRGFQLLFETNLTNARLKRRKRALLT